MGSPEPAQYGDFAVASNVLTKKGIPPDFESDLALRYTHRKEGETEIYFIANPEDHPLSAHCIFRVSGKQPELWDPVQGKTRDLPGFAVKDGRTYIALQFEPHQSFFFVFRKSPGKEEKQTDQNSFAPDTVAEIRGPWEVSFDPKWGGPKEVTFSRLEDWSSRPEEGIKFYSGTATYRTTFDLPPAATVMRKSHPRVWLDLGDVKNIASVLVNGHDLGVLWCAPWRADVSGTVKPKGNRLEVTVANLWPNRLIGDEHLPPDCEFGKDGNLVRWPEWLVRKETRPATGRFAFATWKHFSKDSPLLPSGLLGPVRLLRSDR